MLPRDEVWITGVGAVTPAGAGATALLHALQGTRPTGRMDTERARVWLGRVEDPAVGRSGRRLDRSAQLLLAAAREAWADASLASADVRPDRIAVIEGTSLGPLSEILAVERGRAAAPQPDPPHAAHLIRMMFDAGSAAFAQEIHAAGPVYAVSAGSVSGALAIAEGFWKIRLGLADVAVVGGAECPLHPEIIDVFTAAGVLAQAVGPGVPCRPFDTHRCGTVLAEGGAMLVLESAPHAERRGARPRAVLAGAGMSCESHGMISPDPTGCGVVAAARQALGSLPIREVAWIKAHGTGTPMNDLAECRGLETLFAGGLPGIPLTSLKPLLGHCLGASGSVEAVAALLALEEGIVPPTLGTTEVDPALPRCRVALEAVPAEGSAVLLLSESFGGRCGALVLRRAA
jgi:3-oxoacyl-[acyl-carrier-protein] synthase II